MKYGEEIISRFKEKPKTKIAWRAMYLGLFSLFSPFLLGFTAAVLWPALEKITGFNVGGIIGFSFAVCVLLIAISAFTYSIIAFRQGERSWVLWLGFISAAIAILFFAFLIIGEFVFEH